MHTNNNSVPKYHSQSANRSHHTSSRDSPQVHDKVIHPSVVSTKPEINPQESRFQLVQQQIPQQPRFQLVQQQPRFQLIQQPQPNISAPVPVPIPVPVSIPAQVPVPAPVPIPELNPKPPKLSKSQGIKFAIKQTNTVDALIKKKGQNLEKRAKDALMDYDVIFYQFKTIEKNMYDYDVK